MEKSLTAERFRQRLRELITRSQCSQTAFAARVGVDRSTLSQILSTQSDRLPRVETLAAIAAAEQVSLDWLVGMSTAGEVGANLLQQPLEISPAESSPVDARFEDWYREALGYKIRYVPASLPDFLKDEALIDYEFRGRGKNTREKRVEIAQSRLAYQRQPETDTEVCTPIQTVQDLANGAGIWTDLAPRIRARQLEKMEQLVAELYPTFRWFMFDGRDRFSAPLTLFGPLRAAIYLGQMYFILTGREHIQILVAHFDGLIRAAVMQPPDVVDHLATLRRGIRIPGS